MALTVVPPCASCTSSRSSTPVLPPLLCKGKKVLSVEYKFSLCFSQFSDFWQHQRSDSTNEVLSEHKDAGSFSLFQEIMVSATPLRRDYHHHKQPQPDEEEHGQRCWHLKMWKFPFVLQWFLHLRYLEGGTIKNKKNPWKLIDTGKG